MTTLLLVRHAATDMVGHAISGRAPDIHLNAAGRAQAMQLGERLASLALTAIYSSPLERTLETAHEIARHHSLPVTSRQELTEIDFGEWTGRTLSKLAEVEEWKRFNAFRSSTRIPAGETMLEVQARTTSLLEELAQPEPEGIITIVSHGDVIRSTLCHYLGIPLDNLFRFEVSPASVSVVELHAWGPRVLLVNSTAGEILL